MKRKFHPRRLYKLIRFIVIFATILSAYLSYIAYQNYQTNQPQVIHWIQQSGKDAEACSQMYPTSVRNQMTDAQWKDASAEIDNCYNNLPAFDQKQINYYEDTSLLGGSILTTILLPLIFFGGTALYKYLFPYEGKNRGKKLS